MKLMTTAQVAAASTIPESTLYRWARQWEAGDHAAPGPRPLILGPRAHRYRREDVAAWLGVEGETLPLAAA